MKIAVMGAGSIGCYYGGLLARAGAEVLLIGRSALVDAVAEDGLILEIGGEQQRVKIGASTDAAAVAGADLVLFCVKSGDTEAAGRMIAPHLAADATILCLQNGVDNPDRLRTVVDAAVVPVAVYVATDIGGPGHVRHHGRGDLVMGRCPREVEIAATLENAGIPVRVSDNAVDALWSKLIVNCAYNALSALADLPYGRLIAREGVAAVMTDVVGECIAVAKADGVLVPPEMLDSVLNLAATMPKQMSSTAQDLRKGKPTEIDHLNGFVLRRGAALGVPTPANRVLHTLVKAVEGQPAG